MNARPILATIAIAICALLLGASSMHAQTADEVGAAFIYSFSKYIEWPSKAFADGNAPFTVGFVAKPAMADIFEQHVKGKNVNARDFTVKRLDSAAGADACQIVFIGEASLAPAVLSALKGKPVLTVGAGDYFLDGGGMIAFRKEGARLVFDIDVGQAKAAELKPSPKMETAAHAVKGK